jgi:GntR family transcriptional regulator / MocR family aminotransferase
VIGEGPLVPRTALGIVSLARKDVDRALAERLFENLRNLILDGVWRYGDKLPGTRIIARDAGVSRWTAVVAIDMLIAEGLVEARKRSGTYVAWQGTTRTAEPTPQNDTSAPPSAPFALGVPALDLFPMHVWRKMQARRWRQMPTAALDDGHAAGWPALRQAIAEFAATVRGLSCTAEQIFVVSSVEAAGRLTGQALCRPGSLAWIENPGTSNTSAVVSSAQLVPVSVSVDREGIDVEEGRRVAPGASLAVVTPAAQFPTGFRMSDARRHRLLEWASGSGSWIFEVDHTMEFPSGRAPLAAFGNAGGRVVYFDTFGKMLFPSLRVAYVVVPRDVVNRFQEADLNADRPPPAPNQIILTDFLTSGQLAKHLRRCRDAYAERREALVTTLREECAGLIAIEPGQEGLFICARLPRGVDDVAIVAKARERGVVLAALSPRYDRPTEDRGLLFGFSGYEPNRLREGVKTLAPILKAMVPARGLAAVG